jgi:hypothetical protein
MSLRSSGLPAAIRAPRDLRVGEAACDQQQVFPDQTHDAPQGAVRACGFIFACLGAVTTRAAGRPLEIGVSTAVLIGLGIGLFEEFYVQSPRGNWLRNMHPLRSIPVYVVVIILLYVVAAHLARVLLGRLDDLPTLYRRLPYGIVIFTVFSVIGVLMIRVIHFIGLENLFHLMVGTYHRQVRERKVLLFLDINGSTLWAKGSARCRCALSSASSSPISRRRLPIITARFTSTKATD